MNEKLMILKMLESGQITADEAAKLLNSVGEGGGAPVPAPAVFPPTPPAPTQPTPPRPHGNNGPPPKPGTAPSAPAFDLNDLGRKFENFAKDMAPKVQKFTETVADKIMVAADKVSNTFIPTETSGGHTPPPPMQSQQHQRPATPPRPATTAAPGGMTEQNVEMLVEIGGYNELNLSGLSGAVRVKGYNGDKISAKISYKAKKPGATIEMMRLGNKYFLKYEPDDFQSVTIDAYVPERAFGVVKVDNLNGSIDCQSLAAGDMRFTNANGSVSLSAISAKTIEIEGSNGAMIITGVTAENATIENLNGNLDTHELDIANLKLTNYNGPLSMVMSGFNRHTDYLWNVETGNAKLNMILPTMPDLGYHIKAHATMSEIKLGLTGLQYLINEPSLVEARSVHYDTATKRVKLAVETSNSPLVIN
ncbi:MAG: DUF4097 domain-containing protein [Defluviitaleaceae bacterium]|nr:DUF4097 domain-containing protein [Defluviitaleaceae bacterium]